MQGYPGHMLLALSSNLISDDIKKAIATTLLNYPRTNVDKQELPKVYEDCMDSSIMNHRYITFLI